MLQSVARGLRVCAERRRTSSCGVAQHSKLLCPKINVKMSEAHAWPGAEAETKAPAWGPQAIHPYAAESIWSRTRYAASMLRCVIFTATAALRAHNIKFTQKHSVISRLFSSNSCKVQRAPSASSQPKAARVVAADRENIRSAKQIEPRTIHQRRVCGSRPPSQCMECCCTMRQRRSTSVMFPDFLHFVAVLHATQSPLSY